MPVPENIVLKKNFDSIKLFNENSNNTYRKAFTIRETSKTHLEETGHLLYGKAGYNKIITQSEIMQDLIKQTITYAGSRANILITGESGTGKELFAHLIYTTMKQNNEIPFIKLNCSAIPDSLFESELFGHSKGAFTNALYEKKGKIECAHNGILFLDEIGDMPLSQQAKLLRVIENGEISRIGSNEVKKVDIKIVAATNKDLIKSVREKKFRQDLYFRLNVIHIPVPPLKHHKEDIPLLVLSFLHQFAREENGPLKHIEESAVTFLTTLDFPGNIRQLKSLIYRLYISTEHTILTLNNVKDCVNYMMIETDSVQEDIPVQFPERIFLEKTKPLKEFKKELEKKYIRTQLNKFNGNVTHTARALDIIPGSLFRKMKEFGIKRKDSTHVE